jgi:tripartite-type tricarboxylate transporter receptor subunit TctC
MKTIQTIHLKSKSVPSCGTNSKPVSVLQRGVLLSSAMMACLALPTASWAQAAYPTKTIRVIVPFPPGTSPDVVARHWSERMSKATGQTVIVDNRPGASTIIGAQTVAAAPADGYTLLYAVANTMSINPYIYKSLPYKVDDFVPVSRILSVPFVLVTAPASPIKSTQDMIRAAKDKPGKMNYASFGTGTANHVAMVRLMNHAGISITHIPYKDGGITDVITGVVDVSFEPSTTAIPQLKAGKLRALAVSSLERVQGLPDVPTVAESIPGFVGDSWHGVLVPKRTPPEVVSRLSALSRSIIESPDFRKTLNDLGLVPAGGTPADFENFMKEDARGWSKVIKDNDIKVD